jgi:hypothetical protein
MPPKKKISIGGLTKLSSDYCATIDAEEKDEVPPTPAPAKAKKVVKIKEELPPPPAEDSLESDAEDVVPEPAKNMKARQMTEEHKQKLRDRLALMREGQKKLREEKALLKGDTKKPSANLDDIFEKKYNSHFEFLREKITALTDDMSEIKKAKKDKLEMKAKAEQERKIKEEAKKTAPPPPKPVEPKPAEPKPQPVVMAKIVPTPQPSAWNVPVATPPPPPVFKAPVNDITSFRQQFRKGGFNY